MGRRDFLNDPEAPEANSLVPSVTVAVANESGNLLLIHRTDNGLWALPGGAVDLGESVVDAAVRETKEETGFDVVVTGLVGTYTNPGHLIAYGDGEVRQQFSLCFRGRIMGGAAHTSSETSKVLFVPPHKLAELDIHPSMRLRIQHWSENRGEPYLG